VAAVPVRVGETGPGHEHDLFRRPQRGHG
jgi:hypothetical protein